MRRGEGIGGTCRVKRCLLRNLPLAFITICFVVTVQAQTAYWPNLSLVLISDSRYVSEGRGNLEEGSLVSLEAVTKRGALAFGVWLATGDVGNYDEYNLFLEYGVELGGTEAYVSYTRLEYPEGDEGDNEIGLGFTFNQFSKFVAGVDYVYSTEARGGFVELNLSTSVSLLEGRLTVEPYILEGLDFGYATGEHNGANNFQLGVGISYALTDRLSLVGGMARS